MKFYQLAAIPFFLGLFCFLLFSFIGSTVAPDGTLEEPFFLVLIAYLLIFSSLLAYTGLFVQLLYKKITR